MLGKVSCEATELEKKIHKIGINSNLTGFDGTTEMRAISDEELEKAKSIIRPFII